MTPTDKKISMIAARCRSIKVFSVTVLRGPKKQALRRVADTGYRDLHHGVADAVLENKIYYPRRD